MQAKFETLLCTVGIGLLLKLRVRSYDEKGRVDKSRDTVPVSGVIHQIIT
jgi:hypothetical protein